MPKIIDAIATHKYFSIDGLFFVCSNQRDERPALAEAAAAGDVICWQTPLPATRDAIQAAGNLAGKVVVDCTNPLKLDFTGLALGSTTSGADQVEKWTKGAKVF
jgi:predicted dinucleotide-binding enzyme